MVKNFFWLYQFYRDGAENGSFEDKEVFIHPEHKNEVTVQVQLEEKQ
jgi:hypothetical protein